MVTTLQRFKSLTGKKTDLDKNLDRVRGELEKVRADIADAQARMGAQVLNGKDASTMVDELARLQARETVLLAAIEAGDQAQADQDKDIAAAKRQAAQDEFNRLVKEVESAALNWIKRSYEYRDELGEVAEKYYRARAIYREYPDLATLSLVPSGGIIDRYLAIITEASRMIEIAAPGMIEKAGCRRRF